MLPLIGSESEIVYVKDNVTKAIDAAIMAKNAKIEYKIGIMIEIPRAALTADEIAKHAEFSLFELMI